MGRKFFLQKNGGWEAGIGDREPGMPGERRVWKIVEIKKGRGGWGEKSWKLREKIGD